MKRPPPVIATIVVLIAAAMMVALGVWQLHRAKEKEALLAALSANIAKPPVAYREPGPVRPDMLFRKSSALCLSVTGWRVEGGRTPSGQPGYRHIAECRTGAEGPGLLADMGVSADPKFAPAWQGGPVDGIIASEPDHRSVLSLLSRRKIVLRPMLVADRPAPGLAASAPPSPAAIPNNHRAYAVQWFVFAGLALLIYGLALRRRQTR